MWFILILPNDSVLRMIMIIQISMQRLLLVHGRIVIVGIFLGFLKIILVE